MSDYKRGEALSAIAAAEERFLARDFPAARMLALKARSLFPSLLGLHAAVAAYDVLRRSAAAPKLPSGESDDWQDVFGVVGRSPAHDAVEARYRRLLALLTDPARTKFAAAAADEALKIVERAWREFEASQSPTSHPLAERSRSSSSDGSSTARAESFSFTPKSPVQEKENVLSKPSSAESSPLTDKLAVADDAAAVDLPPSSGGQKLTRSHNLPIRCREPTPPADAGDELAFSGASPMPAMSTLCPRCDDWFQPVAADRRLYLSCVGCGRDYSPRCGQCGGLYKPKCVSGQYIHLVCEGDCRLHVFVQRVTQPSRPRPLSPAPSPTCGISRMHSSFL